MARLTTCHSRRTYLVHCPDETGCENSQDHTGDQLQEEAVEPQVEAEEQVATTKLELTG